ncbi:hypothetical protein H4R18_004528 [Coemansia javaensis]|uniref:Uncharacterized protein n=1 Tax=Coemansia javaensis TaxID=2761396 RepID=A0A9W8LEQ2_9FUNG|nr:hypothetical protein H4R18_004528 [Coemansia javaensis]
MATSYARRAATERVPLGRADEIHSGHSNRSADSIATTASGTHTPPRPAAALPPLPDVDTGALSLIGKAPPAHRRRASDAGAPGGWDGHVTAAAAAAAAEPPRHVKPRRGLANLRVAWPSARARRPKSADASGERTQWAASEAEAVAQASLGAWRSGCPVDRAALAAGLGRPVAAVSEMLEYMLEGYARFGSTAWWDAQSHRLVLKWAAVEFPHNPALGPLPDRPRTAGSDRPRSRSRLDACLAALTCGARAGPKPGPYALDAGSNDDVADFRDGMRSRAHGPDHAQATAVATPASRPATAVEPALPEAPAEPRASAMQRPSRASTASRERPRSAANAAQLPARRGTSLRDAGLQTDGDAAPAVSPAPSFGARSRRSAATPGLEARAHSTRRSPARLDRPAPGTVSAGAAAATLLLRAGGGAAAAAPADGPPGLVAARRRAATATTHGARLPSNRLSRDSGHVEIPDAEASDPDDAGRPAGGLGRAAPVRQSDAEIDDEFGDLAPEVRQKVRRFVSRFIQLYPNDFQKRVDAHRGGSDAMCIAAEYYTNFDAQNSTDVRAIERVYREVGGSMLYTRNLFFHAQLRNELRLEQVPVGDDSWFRINDYATEIFNYRIQTAQFVVLDECPPGATTTTDAAAAAAAADGTGFQTPRLVRDGPDARPESGSGDRHLEKFNLMLYMDPKAKEYVSFLSTMYVDELREWADAGEARPMPVALRVDRSKLRPFEAKVRDSIVGYIWADIPYSRRTTREAMLLRALELANARIAELRGYTQDGMYHLMNSRNKDGPAESDRPIEDAAALHEIPRGQIAQTAGRAFARAHFDANRAAFLLALMNDHPFRPVGREETKVWISHGQSSFGRDVDYSLNAGLYRYLHRLRLRPSSKQWLQASAAATLSMLRRTVNAVRSRSLVAHIDLARYEAHFARVVQEASAAPEAAAHNTATLSVAQDTAADPSAFDRVPSWVTNPMELEHPAAAPANGGAANGQPSAHADGTDSPPPEPALDRALGLASPLPGHQDTVPMPAATAGYSMPEPEHYRLHEPAAFPEAHTDNDSNVAFWAGAARPASGPEDMAAMKRRLAELEEKIERLQAAGKR